CSGAATRERRRSSSPRRNTWSSSPRTPRRSRRAAASSAAGLSPRSTPRCAPPVRPRSTGGSADEALAVQLAQLDGAEARRGGDPRHLEARPRGHDVLLLAAERRVAADAHRRERVDLEERALARVAEEALRRRVAVRDVLDRDAGEALGQPI